MIVYIVFVLIIKVVRFWCCVEIYGVFWLVCFCYNDVDIFVIVKYGFYIIVFVKIKVKLFNFMEMYIVYKFLLLFWSCSEFE